MAQELIESYKNEFTPIYGRVPSISQWEFSQMFGEQNIGSEGHSESDGESSGNSISSLRFDSTGEYLAVGYNCGQVVVLKQQPDSCVYQLYTEFKSHEVEFDFLTSVEVEEKINTIRWYPFPYRNTQRLLTTNDRTIKLFKMNEKTTGFGGNKKTEIFVKPDRIYENGHLYNINSISFSSDGETFISSDDLRVNLWNININDETLNTVDIRPEKMEDLSEVITCSDFHPHNSSIFVYSSSKGYVRLGDLRTSAICESHARIFKSNTTNKSGTNFEEMLYAISDVGFSPCGRMMASRDYLKINVWDLRYEHEPLITKEFDSYLVCNLSNLYESDAIFDKFEVSWSNDSSRLLTGSYNGRFFVIDTFSGRMESFRVANSGYDQSASQMDINTSEGQKVLHTAWNPNADLIVLRCTKIMQKKKIWNDQFLDGAWSDAMTTRMGYEEMGAYWECSIFNWYRNKELASITFPTQFIAVPKELVNAIGSSEGIRCSKRALVGLNAWNREFLDDEWAGDYSESSSSSDQQECEESVEMSEFHDEITSRMKRWIKPRSGDGVFVKGLWNSTVDAYWMVPGGDNKCTTSDEVILLVQSSDLIREDLELFIKIMERRGEDGEGDIEEGKIFANFPQKYHLTLRKWHPVNQSMEFRCFVRHGTLVAICQRNVNNYWPFLSDMQLQISEKIENFWREKIARNFAMDSYVFDVYIHSNGGVWLMDFSPFLEGCIDPILWTWDELNVLNENCVKMKLMESDVNLLPNMKLAMSGIPYDLANEEECKSADFQNFDFLQKIKKA